MFRTLFKAILIPIVVYLLSKIDPVEELFAPYLTHRQLSVLLLLTLLLTLLICVLILLASFQNNKYKKHPEEQRMLFNHALSVIRRRNGITLEQINEFKAALDKYKFFIQPKQEKHLKRLISFLGDVRIDDEELKDADLPSGKRKSLVAHRRELLNNIESSTTAIDKYIRKIT